MMKKGREFIKVVSFLICYIMFLAILPVNAYAATSSNSNIINNNSILVKEGDWLYYRNSSDGGSIYKIKINGTGNTKLNDVSSSNISIQGDWIYFKTINPNDDNKNYKMMRIKKDGYQAIPQDLGFSSDNEVFMDGYIYFVKKNDGIYKVSADGSGTPRKLADAIHGGIRRDYIFYENFIDENDSLGTYLLADLEGNNGNIVGDTNQVTEFTNDWVYLSIYGEGEADGLYGVSIDGEVKKVDNDSLANVVNDDWIYTYDYASGNAFFKSMDGTVKIKDNGASTFKSYTGNVWTGINMVDNWFAFQDGVYNCLSLVNSATGEKVKLYKNAVDENILSYELNPYSLLKDGNYVYYINEANDGEKFLYKYDLNTGKTQKLSPEEDIQKVSDKKKWTITFNKAIDLSTINNKTFIVTDGDNQPVNVEISISSDGKSITLGKKADNWEKYRTINYYHAGGKQIYNLRITKDVKGQDGTSLKEDVLKKFEVN